MAVAVTAGWVLGGCASKHEQLEAIAKDWCETIRASQVIPVYPLTEDLRPGDVFLVQTAISDEATRYRKKGFLPLDDYRTRLELPPEAFAKQYFDGYWKDVFRVDGPNSRPTRTPGVFPKDPAAGGGNAGATLTPRETLLSSANAPRVAFPSYTFTVSNSGGLSLAIPIQSIPLALGALHADSATGSVTIADARTCAANPDIVYQYTKAWASRDEIRFQLRSAARTAKAPVYVRVITRVYYAGAMNVSLAANSAFATDVAGGKAPDIDLIDANGNVNNKNIKALKAMNSDPDKEGSGTAGDPLAPTSSASTPAVGPGAASPAPELPHPSDTAAGANDTKSSFDWANAGVRFKFQSLSSRSVSMAEMFDTPLVIGYLGFDAPVYLNGEIGPPLPTFLRLEGVISSPSELRAAEGRYLQQVLLIDKMVQCPPTDPAEQLRYAEIIKGVSKQLGTPFVDAGKLADEIVQEIKAHPQQPSSSIRSERLQQAARRFGDAADKYVGSDSDAEYPVRTNRLIDAFDTAFESTRVPKGR